jgi:DNA-binding NarL/FixJ family response regulator
MDRGVASKDLGGWHEDSGGGLLVVTKPTTVLIADDHPPTRAGVRAALEATDFEVCAELPNAEAAVEAALRLRPDVSLLDIHMPGNGIAAAAKIKAELPSTVVVMLTVSRQDDDLFAALRAGASGYLLKDTDPDRLAHALRGVLQGEAALPRTLVARLIEEFQSREQRRLPLLRRKGVRLTPREWEVLELMNEGLSTSEMAERIFVSKATIRSHVASVVRKLRVADRKAAVRLLEDERQD